MLVLCKLVSSCFLALSAAHGHLYQNTEKSNAKIKLRVFCTQNRKQYIVSGFEKNEEVYINSAKMKNIFNHCLPQNIYGDSAKVYSLRIGDSNFHRKLLNDTVKVKIIKSNSTIEIYKFLIMKDRYIKS